MEVLWAPWRLDYILGPKPDSCPFCLPEHTDEDEQRKILFRGQHAFVIMNIYPYTNGHLMVTPYRHVMNLVDLRTEEHHEIMDLIHACTRILQTHFHPQGINIGVNIGEAAGAGIKEHLHFHLVPRWVGDSSFMAVMSEARIVPEHLEKTYAKLRPYFDELRRTKQSAKEDGK
ncbi:HIT family protein [Desulfobaculum bizertense]|uniref:Diadenosine tetraphosphate (Ap4A) hydrolase n=1 Tax=Desulfobaculum bizertense DSM 18034 TaxID=1121442 RepID=A0A1T4W263_9BACT|nr:HIT domain-containing protein [Desulfobaculum bizertense]UIJ38894.1 HIT domain-containing protein [Desulfobaculum bizertense]SKA71155.1 Diadenosine tetraphosphate (Ap4A) hydrolase [Desulfobaculum bizertense DSM 18034]